MKGWTALWWQFLERCLHTKFGGDPGSSPSRVIVVYMIKIIKFTSVNSLNVGQGDPYTIPSKFSMRGTYKANLVILLISFLSYRGNVNYMLYFTKLSSVTLKVGQGDPYTIPSRFPVRGTYTPNLVILAHSLLKWSRYENLDARQTDGIMTTIPFGQSLDEG